MWSSTNSSKREFYERSRLSGISIKYFINIRIQHFNYRKQRLIELRSDADTTFTFFIFVKSFVVYQIYYCPHLNVYLRYIFSKEETFSLDTLKVTTLVLLLLKFINNIKCFKNKISARRRTDH